MVCYKLSVIKDSQGLISSQSRKILRKKTKGLHCYVTSLCNITCHYLVACSGTLAGVWVKGCDPQRWVGNKSLEHVILFFAVRISVKLKASFISWWSLIRVAFCHWKVFFVLQKPLIEPLDPKEAGGHFRSRMEPDTGRVFNFQNLPKLLIVGNPAFTTFFQNWVLKL